MIGDFIIVDDFMGSVEFIGMKTTRLRSPGCEQISSSNTGRLKNRIRNDKRMEECRVLFESGAQRASDATPRPARAAVALAKQ